MFKNKHKILEKIRNTLQEPSIRGVSRFAASALEISSFIDFKSPLSVSTGALSLFSAGIDAFEFPEPTKIELFIKKKNLKSGNSKLPKLIVDAGLDKKLDAKPVLVEYGWHLYKIDIDGEQFYYSKYADNSNPVDPAHAISERYLFSENFDFEKLCSHLWDRYGKGIHLSVYNPEGGNFADRTPKLHSLCFDSYLYIGDIDVGKFADNIVKFKERGISRSFMLVGEPGCGKTSFCYNVGKALNGRILKIDPSIANSLSNSDMDLLLENLRPDVLVFDDFDRLSSSFESMSLLFLLENIKNRFKQTTVFATVNNFNVLDKAVVRPGRFDKIMWFDYPSEEIRKKITIKYLDDNDIIRTDDLVSSIVFHTKDFSPVYIKELCTRLGHDPESSVEEIVEDFKNSLGSTDNYEEQDEDDEEDL